MPRKLYYMLHSGKNSKLCYYLHAYLWIHLPHWLMIWTYRQQMKMLKKRNDQSYIWNRVNYYNQLSEQTPIDREAFLQASVTLRDQRVTGQKVYYLDSYCYARCFPLSQRWVLLPGDIVHVPNVPSITKSRPLVQHCENSVLFKMDKVRHFIFVNDRKPFREKKNQAIFRGLIGQEGSAELKKNRYDFVVKYFNHPLCDVGVVDQQYPQWRTEKLTIGEHLDYKFIFALEGNDVASNLKWVMSSNSVAVMPRPTCETWFMEGTLIPDYHYIEIESDYSDVGERLAYYIDHPDKAEEIILHAHEFVNQFRDKKREKLISLLVLKKYFDQTSGI